MQGRITKVLNMKPIETLGMIEEAAGTKMFEMKKQNALATIKKKEAKRAEIQKVTAICTSPSLSHPLLPGLTHERRRSVPASLRGSP